MPNALYDESVECPQCKTFSCYLTGSYPDANELGIFSEVWKYVCRNCEHEFEIAYRTTYLPFFDDKPEHEKKEKGK